MSTENKVLDLGYKAAEDLSGDQFHFVILDPTTGNVRRPDSAVEVPIGILQNKPKANEIADVMLIGISKSCVNGAVVIGDFVKPEYVAATDAGKGEKAGTNWKYARAIVTEAASAEDELASVLLCGPFPLGSGTLIGQTVATVEVTAGAHTYSAAELLGGLILRDPTDADRSDPTDTAVNIIAAIKQVGVGNSFEFTIINTADAAETITVGAGTDVTLSGTMTIAQSNAKRFLCLVTAATTVTIYSLGTVTF